MPGKKITPRQWERYRVLRSQGWGQAAACREVGVSVASARVHDRRAAGLVGDPREAQRAARSFAGPVPVDSLSDPARRALGDFGFFQQRYLGRIATPWQVEAANLMVELLASPDKEFVVLNAPPGAGKSTLFTHDIPAWLTCRNRAIRGLIGSRTQRQANRYTARLIRTFERTLPVQAEDEQKAKGLAVDAVACLGDDFGAFKSEHTDKWSQQEFVVAQHENRLIDEKESTWAAYGFDSGYLGMRYDFVIWDDLVDRITMRTAESVERLEADWDDIAEKRLEPGGVLVLQGQRLAPNDLYRYCLNKRLVADDDLDEDQEDEEAGTADLPAKYKHFVYRAHDEARCDGSKERHRPSAPYWPDGCLLDPRRLSWRELAAEMANPRGNFATLYQQEDVDPEDALVQEVWVTGGTNPKTGELHPGCKDPDRGLWELPRGLAGQWLIAGSVDPSPTKYWSVQVWAVRCEGGIPYERFLLDHYRGKLDMPGFLDEARGAGHDAFIGLAEDWQTRSEKLGIPIQHWIVEVNAAQRFMLQTEVYRRWAALHKVTWVPHTTSTNKSDPDFGVPMLGPVWKAGLVRLPYMNSKSQTMRSAASLASMKLVEEVTHWPKWGTEDCVMSQWFLEKAIPNLMPRPAALPRFERPRGIMSVTRSFYKRTVNA